MMPLFSPPKPHSHPPDFLKKGKIDEDLAKTAKEYTKKDDDAEVSAQPTYASFYRT